MADNIARGVFFLPRFSMKPFLAQMKQEYLFLAFSQSNNMPCSQHDATRYSDGIYEARNNPPDHSQLVGHTCLCCGCRIVEKRPPIARPHLVCMLQQVLA